mmetsp:Transcript_18278/g.18463  ORF Transcript_18278/g.18463 Transcript_18278/m.18463 type:complete len:97 (+) Transcript_18278:144-434(+)
MSLESLLRRRRRLRGWSEQSNLMNDFNPTGFFLKHPLKVLSLRHWFTDDHHTYIPGPKSLPPYSTLSLSPSPTMKAKVSDLFQRGQQQRKVTPTTV